MNTELPYLFSVNFLIIWVKFYIKGLTCHGIERQFMKNVIKWTLSLFYRVHD